MRCLVVEDEPIIGIDILLSLQDCGVAAEYVTCAEDALKKIENNTDAPYDCIISDIKMKGLSGLDLFKRLVVKAHDQSDLFEKTPFCFVTAYSNHVDLDQLHVDDYPLMRITKPIPPEFPQLVIDLPQVSRKKRSMTS